MVRVYEDAEELARAVAEVVVRAAAESIAAREEFRLGLSGGKTPVRLYTLLASDGYRDKIDWPRVTVLFADERAVSPGHPDSNYRLVRETLLGPAGIPEENVHRMRGEVSGLKAEAHDYEAFLVEPIDLLLLGVGSDGHIASIIPGTAVAEEKIRRVVAVTNSPKPPPSRLTLTRRPPRQISYSACMKRRAPTVAGAGAVPWMSDSGAPATATRCEQCVEVAAHLAADDGWKDLPDPAAHLGTYLAREGGVSSGDPDRLASTTRDAGLLPP